MESLADVRRFSGSRRLPHFNSDALKHALSGRGIRYLHVPDLGGRRRARPDSANGAWEGEAFRGYADHMATNKFKEALDTLMNEAAERPTACMCAEGLWWRCHRRLLSDALVARGWKVGHIMPDGQMQEHRLTDFAVLKGVDLSYPAPQPTLPLDA